MHKNTQVKVSVWQRVWLIILGVFLSLVILEIGLRAGGFVLLSLQEYKNRLSLKQKGVYRIMCLGESTTQGQYPVFLEEILNQSNIGIKFSVIDKGLSGINTNFILSQLKSNLDTYKPDMVVTMMGTNDVGIHGFYKSSVFLERLVFLRSLKVYNLFRLLWLHIAVKAEEIEGYKQRNNRRFIRKQDFPFLDFRVKSDYIKDRESISQEAINEYMKLGWAYLDQGRLSEAEQISKIIIKHHSNSEFVYTLLGEILSTKADSIFEAEEAFKKALKVNSRNVWIYIRLGTFYRNYSRFFEAEQAFKKGLELDSQTERLYVELGVTYIEQGKFSEAEQLLKKAIGLNPKNYWANTGLESIYFKEGNNELFKEYMNKAEQLMRKEFIPRTIYNYLKLKQILERKGVAWVCAQYPMLNIRPLKKIFEGQKGVIFVDNEEIFKGAVKSDNYKAYFRDMFAVDFGHCTDKGNKLLARNIADAILKEVFKK